MTKPRSMPRDLDYRPSPIDYPGPVPEQSGRLGRFVGETMEGGRTLGDLMGSGKDGWRLTLCLYLIV